MIIYLIGFMGSGKSTIGKILAHELGYAFLDTDKMIEDEEGRSIKDIFKTDGEAYFRNLESNVVKHIKGHKETVVATGGGLPCNDANIDALNESGITVYLHLKSKSLLSRLSKSEQINRPLLSGSTSEDNLLRFIQTKLIEREQFYFKSQLMIDGDDIPKNVVKALTSHLQVNNNS